MVYNLNESLDYNRGAATRKTAPQTTKTTIDYLTKRVIFRAIIILNSFIMIINSFIISFITSISYIIILIIIFNINITNN